MYRLSANENKSYITIIFFNGRKQEVITHRNTTEGFKDLVKSLKAEHPDRIRIELFVNESTKPAFSAVFVKKVSFQESIPQQQFKGFGEAEIQNMVDQRFREQKRIEEFERLQSEVTELTTEVNDQQIQIEQLEDENEQLKIELEGKKQIRYYAGMLGDILEGIGISKDKIRNPIASLMGIADDIENKEISQTPVETQTDSSGIVEEVEQEQTVEQKHRNEVVALMTEYLKTRDNLTLSNLFTIFSEVEKNPKMAFDIIAFIESKTA
jgi:hypothetical protein